MTGQPSDRLGEDFSEVLKDFTERLTVVEELARATNKKLTQGVGEFGRASAVAKDEAAKNEVKAKQQKTLSGLRTCNNILSLAQPLHQKAPAFIGDQKINLSWKEAPKASATTAANAGTKRPAATVNGAGLMAGAKKGRGDGAPPALVNRALAGLSRGRGSARGGIRGGWRGGRGRGRGFW